MAAIISFAQLHAEVTEHWRREAAKNTPGARAVAAIEDLFAALAECEPTERADILALVSSEICLAGVEPIPA